MHRSCHYVVAIASCLQRHGRIIPVTDGLPRCVRWIEIHVGDVVDVFVGEKEKNGKLVSRRTLIFEEWNDSVIDEAMKVVW